MAKIDDKRKLRVFLAEGGDAWSYQGPLSDALIVALPPQGSGNRIKYDATIKGFGVRVTAQGGRAFVLNYRSGRRERRITIGSFPDWTTEPARAQAAALKRQVDDGKDPMLARHAARTAPLVNQLIDRFEAEHVAHKRPRTQLSYRYDLRNHVAPVLGGMPVADVTTADIQKLHRRIVARGAPYQANRVVMVLSSMFGFAIKHGLCTTNPTKGVERVAEFSRMRFLTPDEMGRILAELSRPRRGAEKDIAASADATRLLLWTGARTTEVLSATWDQFDLPAGVWTKPAPSTKQQRLHRVPLAPPALALLLEMKQAANGSPFLFPGNPRNRNLTGSVPRKTIWNFWKTTCARVGITGVRAHDIRHSFASFMASSGVPLQVVGQLLGHASVATTEIYAHLYDSVLRDAVDRITVADGGTS